jgi:hypothetical protein
VAEKVGKKNSIFYSTFLCRQTGVTFSLGRKSNQKDQPPTLTKSPSKQEFP